MTKVGHGLIVVGHRRLTYFVFFGQAYSYEVDWPALFNAAVDPPTFMLIYRLLRFPGEGGGELNLLKLLCAWFLTNFVSLSSFATLFSIWFKGAN